MRLNLMKTMFNVTEMKPLKKLELDLHEMNQIHKAMVEAYRSATQARTVASQAFAAASHARCEAYQALSKFESLLLDYEEKTLLSPMQKFKFVTRENPEDSE